MKTKSCPKCKGNMVYPKNVSGIVSEFTKYTCITCNSIFGSNLLKRGIAVFFVLSIVLFSGCLGSQQGKQELSIAGSTTVQPIANKVAEIFMNKNPGTIITIQGGGSGTGIKMVSEGSVDIGTSSRELKKEELDKNPELRTYTIAFDGIAIITHPSNSLSELTKQQVQDIFSGKIKNFKEIGGPDKEIVVIIREEGSGTRGTFEELVMGKVANSADSLQKPSNGAVKTIIAGNENAIGYISVGYADDTVKKLKVDGVLPSKDTIKDNTYAISRKLYMITKGEPTELEKKFIDFVLSSEGQAIVEEEGFITVK